MRVLDTLHPPVGLNVLITGGAAGIGAQMARAFVEAGSKVHVCDIDAAALSVLAAQAPGISTTCADVARPADADRVMGEAGAALGGLDVLINNAGIAGPTGAIDDIEAEDWSRTIEVNLSSHFHFARRVVPLLRQSGANPCLITMSSVAGRLGYAYRTPYAATKWALIGLMKSLAIELGPQGIRVNAILPGVVEGPRMDKVIAARAAATGRSIETMRASYLERISLRRMVGAEDVAATALFLCSPAARNITGQAISVDGNVEYL